MVPYHLVHEETFLHVHYEDNVKCSLTEEHSLIDEQKCFYSKINNVPTSMKQSPSEADSHSAGQETAHLLETKGSLPCRQEPTAGPYPESDISSSHLPILPP
jgi:hypothetical protein